LYKGDRQLKWHASLSNKWDSAGQLHSPSGGSSDFPDAAVASVQFAGDFSSESAY